MTRRALVIGLKPWVKIPTLVTISYSIVWLRLVAQRAGSPKFRGQRRNRNPFTASPLFAEIPEHMRTVRTGTGTLCRAFPFRKFFVVSPSILCLWGVRSTDRKVVYSCWGCYPFWKYLTAEKPSQYSTARWRSLSFNEFKEIIYIKLYTK